MSEFDEMPRNVIGNAKGDKLKTAASGEGISEEEWRAKNLPAEKIVLRWRYVNKEIQLYERRLRSLRSYNVGPAVQAWVRSRLEWVRDNKLYEKPNGVIVLSIDPEGDVDIQLEEWEAPQEGCAGTTWAAVGTTLTAAAETGELRDAADTFVKDLAGTLGYDIVVAAQVPEAADERFLVNDEFGVVALNGGPITAKMQACFEKLWAPK